MEVNKKKVSKTIAAIGIASVFSSLSFAVTPGAYFGGGVGLGTVSNLTDTTVKNNGGVGGKVVAGFNFNQYLGIEAGYAMYPQTSYFLDEFKMDKVLKKLSVDLNLNAFNLGGKLYIPMGKDNTWDIYGLLGMAYVIEKMEFKFTDTKSNSLTIPLGTHKAAVFAGGGGISHQINKHFRTGIETLVTAKKRAGEIHPGAPQTILTTLNFYYNFG